jgi:hypothetical protein
LAKISIYARRDWWSIGHEIAIAIMSLPNWFASALKIDEIVKIMKRGGE